MGAAAIAGMGPSIPSRGGGIFVCLASLFGKFVWTLRHNLREHNEDSASLRFGKSSCLKISEFSIKFAQGSPQKKVDPKSLTNFTTLTQSR